MISNQPVKVFISYSHKDKDLRAELVRYLKPLERQGLISIGYDRNVSARVWEKEINKHLEEAQIILLLVSPDYVASTYCYSIEMKYALEQSENGNARVIPLILRPADWHSTPFGKFQALPKNAKPLTTWANRDEAFVEIIQGIRRVVEDIDSFTSAVSLEETQSVAFEKLKIFISYSHQDENMLHELLKHGAILQRQRKVEFWTDRMIPPGVEWQSEIYQRLNTSNIILILLSPAYLSSNYLQEFELQKALERHDSVDTRIIPVILSSINLSSENPLYNMQALPRDGKPVNTWEHRDEAWTDVMRGLDNVIRNLQKEVTFSDEQNVVKTYTIGEIFRTAGTPELNYEEPSEFESFKVELQTLGKGLAVEGPSGIGKTSTMRRVLNTIQPTLPSKWISSVSNDSHELLDDNLNQGFDGYLIIDDFHHLSDEYKDHVAKAIKFQSEQNAPKSKIIVIGINRVGHMLMEGFPELAGRVGIISMNKQPDEKVQAMIEKGERAANITFRSRAQIVEAAYGSFFTAQHLCLYIARKAGVTQTQNRHKIIEYGPTDVISEVLEQFEFKYRKLLNRLASVDASNLLKGAGLVLLWLLRCEGVGYILIDEARRQYPDLEQNFDKLVNGDLQACFNENAPLANLFFYDYRAGILVLEDPQLAFYLRNIRWTEFARHAGHQITISENEELIFKETLRFQNKFINQFFPNMNNFWNSLSNPVKVFLTFGLIGLASIGVVQYDNLPFIQADPTKTENKQNEMVEVQLLVQREDGQPIANVEIQVVSQGAPTTIYTNSSGYARLKIPSRDDVDILLRKEGYEVRTETVNLSTDPDRNKSFRLKKLN